MIVLKKPFFTLLELLVVIFILSLIAAVSTIKIKEAYAEQRFLSEVEQVIDHLQMAQDFMLILDTDAYVELTKYEKGPITYRLILNKPLVIKESKQNETNSQTQLKINPQASVKWMKLLEREIPLHAIYSFAFKGNNDEMKDDDLPLAVAEKLRLRFSLTKMSEGTLALSTHEKIDEIENKDLSNDTRYVCLKGYPCAIRLQSREQDIIMNRQESQQLYPRLKD